jgi:peptidyl-Lys metalloendopeptidase
MLCVSAFLSIPVSANAEQKISESLRCEMSMQKNTLRITLKNVSKNTWSVMRRGTPLEGFLGDHLTVEHDGKRMNYIGPMVKRAAPTAAEYWIIAPKRSRTISLPLANGYDVTQPGSYSIQWSGTVSDVRDAHVKSYDEATLKPAALHCPSIAYKR